MQMGSMGKRPNNYENIGKETKTKAYKLWQFNESEEAEVKEWVNKQKLKPRKIAENNKLLKKKKKNPEENKIEEKDMWEHLSKLNGEFKNIKKTKKEAKNCLRQ